MFVTDQRHDCITSKLAAVYSLPYQSEKLWHRKISGTLDATAAGAFRTKMRNDISNQHVSTFNDQYTTNIALCLTEVES